MSAESEVTQFKLRMSSDLKHRIERAAAAGGRSLNREIIARLEASLELDGGSTNSANSGVLNQIAGILSAASAAFSADWIDDAAAVELVRSSIDHALQGRSASVESEPELSEEALAAFERWKNATGAEGKSPSELNSELRELELREKVIGLTVGEQDRLSAIKKLKSANFSFDGLAPADRKALKRKIESEQSRADFWRRVSPLFSGPPGQDRFRPGARRKW